MQYYIDYIETNIPFLLLNDPETEYEFFDGYKSRNNSHLHKIVMNTKKHKILEEYLKLYLETEKGKDELNLTNKAGYTALLLSCYFSNTKSSIETVKILIEEGAILDLQTRAGFTALILSCAYSNTKSNIETVKILIEAGANLDLQTIDGYTALMATSLFTNTTSTLETIKLLIKSGANLDLQNKDGFTALIIAYLNHDTTSTLETVKLLIEAGADLDLKNTAGETILMLACNRQNSINTLEIIKLLIKAKANLDLQNKFGYTALMFFLKNNNVDSIHEYLEYYKNMNKLNLYKFISIYQIPINTYDYLIDNKIISPIKSKIYSKRYSNSKYHIKITIDLRILNTYSITETECIICSETTKTITCKHNHSTCFRCLYSLNYKCHECQTEL